MKKKFTQATLKWLSFFIILIFLACTGNGQCVTQGGDNANNYPKPYMWSVNNPQWVENFVEIKEPELDKYYAGVEQPSLFVLGNFLCMISYFNKQYVTDFQCLHVYIAAYSKENDPKVPQGYGKKLMLIFAPAKGKTDIGDYYAIPPNTPFDETNAANFKINDVQKEWRENYTNDLVNSLSKTIGNFPDDQIQVGKFSDTRCITYCRQDVLDLVAEQTYTHKNFLGGTIDLSNSMLARFAAFGMNGNPRRSKSSKKRLFVQFDFLDNAGHIVYLEDTQGFWGRAARKQTCADCLPVHANDNGQLCPPSTNCPTN
jgi:hypothetical protein